LEDWEKALQVGILPDTNVAWPLEPLQEKIKRKMLDLGVPRITLKHNELIPAVLKSLVQLSLEYSARVKEAVSVKDENNYEDSETHDDFYDEKDVFIEDHIPESLEDQLAADVINSWSRLWAPPVNALDVMDNIFGPSHGIMDFKPQDLSGGGGGGSGGFGIFDGVWQDTGWIVMRDLQKEIKGMPELRELMKVLGKRASIEGREFKKTPPRSNGKYPGVFLNPILPNEVACTNSMIYRLHQILFSYRLFRLQV
jgi:hypothetical protein